MKNSILQLLKNNALSSDLIAKLLNEDIDIVEGVLKDMVEDGSIKYSEGIELYKLNKKKKADVKRTATADSIYTYLADMKYQTYNELLRMFNINKKELSALLNTLIKEGKIYREFCNYAEYYSVPFEGTISINSRGNGFISDEEGEYFVDYDNLLGALNGDKVLACRFPNDGHGELDNAYVVKVLERNNRFIVGELCRHKTKSGRVFYYVTSRMKTLPYDIDVDSNDLGDSKPNDIVEAEILYDRVPLKCRVTNVIGHKDDPGVDISCIALEYNFKLPFSSETMDELDSISDEVKESDLLGRRDFRDLNIITIDGNDSKDYDDAVYLEKHEDYYELQVHIADVAHYVLDGSALNKDALTRGTSVYLADRVIPMLPRKLSNGICSLNEGVDRLVLSCIMKYDFKGKLLDYEICEGVINSHHRMTYDNVNLILNNDEEMTKRYPDLVDMLFKMRELSLILRELRSRKGAIEFEAPEYKFTLDKYGVPIEYVKRERADSEKLIEDFMLAANETVAYHMNIMNLPCMYRVHEKPDQEKLHDIMIAVRKLDNRVPEIKKDIKHHDIQRILELVSDNKNHEIIHSMLLRGMMKAKYSDTCLGHYGLAMQYYCHFTSPIRRYPDLITHRIIKDVLINSKNNTSKIDYYANILYDIASRNSASERRAIECEREVNSMLCAWYMQSKGIDEVFTGTITSITQFGMYVTLSDGIEGLLAYRNMNGYFDFDSVNLRAISDKKVYKLGDKVRVKIYSADKLERKIDFILEKDGDYFENRFYK